MISYLVYLGVLSQEGLMSEEKAMLKLLMSIYVYTTGRAAIYGQMVIHSHFMLLVGMLAHYYVRRWVIGEDSDHAMRVGAAGESDGVLSDFELVDCVEVFMVVMQMRYLPQRVLHEIDLEAVDPEVLQLHFV